MKIYVTRHGETVWNFENKLCGSTDIKLTSKGIGQAQALAKTLGGRGIEAIIASPLKRARQTAQILAQA
ncbi:MAG: histidine phosphatase family protein, partial [Oscillospiraceae bacterium]